MGWFRSALETGAFEVQISGDDLNSCVSDRENESDQCKIPHGSEARDIIDGSNVNTTTVLSIWPSTRNINQKHTGQSLSPIVAKLKNYGVSP